MVGTVTVNPPGSDLVITEIMYNPPEEGIDSLEFIEIYNNTDQAINLGNYAFTNGVTFTFPGTNLGSGEYAVVAVNAAAIDRLFGITAFEWTESALGNGGELITLVDPDGQVVDEVDYGDAGEWPSGADGFGASLVLCDVNAENNSPASWKTADTGTGVIINGLEVYANPGGASQCPDGPVIGFTGAGQELEEGMDTLMIQIVVNNGSGEEVSVNVSVNTDATTASPFIDYLFIDQTYTLGQGVTQDTIIAELFLLDDSVIDSTRTIVLELSEPSANAAIDPIRDTYTITVLDDDLDIPNLVISEIFYNNPGVDDYEFVEIYNNDDESIDLVGYAITGIGFTFPTYVLAAGDAVVIAKDSAIFRAAFGVETLQWPEGEGLSNGGERLTLTAPTGNRVDQVDYGITDPWDPDANGTGPSLDLCNIDSDNNDPENWKAANTPTGFLISGIEVLATPGTLRDNCDDIILPPSEYPPYSIGVVTTNAANGEADSLGIKCQLQGIVYGVNLWANGLSFTIIGADEEGIHVFSQNDKFNYTVTEADEVVIRGTIAQFNGLTEIVPDTLWMLSNGNNLVAPTVVTNVGEATESQLIKVNGLTIVNPSEWTNSGPGFNVTVTNGTDEFQMRIDDLVDIFGTTPPDYVFNLTGIGGQFDENPPYDDGYQIFPRYLQDIERTTSIIDPKLGRSLRLYPNPVLDRLEVNADLAFDRIEISNAIGQRILRIYAPDRNTSIDMTDFAPGIYTITVVKDGRIWTEKISKT